MEETERVVPLALSLVLGGAIGNLIDRVRLGEVIDFIYFHYHFNFSLDLKMFTWRVDWPFAWPAFNVADIGITAGVILLVLRMFVFEGRTNRQAPQPDNQRAPKP
jgi:signal peptidase II